MTFVKLPPPRVFQWEHITSKIQSICGVTFLTKGRTYGDSQFPFNSPYVSREYHYGPELVPGAVEGLGSVVVRGIHEHMNEDDIRDIARAIKKVAHGLGGSA